MLISHEVPISMLEESRSFNCFSYALVHLFEKYPEYYNFYKAERTVYDREVLLDNSIFELGKAFDSCKFFAAVVDLKPTMYIVPDALEDTDTTIEQFDDWKRSRYHAINSTFQSAAIGVVQGKTWQQLLECYKYMVDEANMIAISFDYSYYDITGEGQTKEQRHASGRQRFISQLIEKGVWDWNKPVHLLGISKVDELRYYTNNNIYNCRSVDSSNPVLHGLHNIRYNSTFGLQTKLKTKLVELIEAVPTEEQLECIQYNIKQFRQIVRGSY